MRSKPKPEVKLLLMIAGITGGMGCGKSTVARRLEEHGFRRLDSDALIRERVLTATGVQAALRARYGEGVFGPDGGVDRAALAGRVFAEGEGEAERGWLEELTHPVLFGIWR